MLLNNNMIFYPVFIFSVCADRTRVLIIVSPPGLSSQCSRQVKLASSPKHAFFLLVVEVQIVNDLGGGRRHLHAVDNVTSRLLQGLVLLLDALRRTKICKWAARVSIVQSVSVCAHGASKSKLGKQGFSLSGNRNFCYSENTRKNMRYKKLNLLLLFLRLLPPTEIPVIRASKRQASLGKHCAN